jgi:N-acetylmuramoyl-L-alanine amidase
MREVPPKNAIRNIVYRRNRINIVFDAETVAEPPAFSFTQVSDSMYTLDIAEGNIGYTRNRTYNYGDVSSIVCENTDDDSARITFTFSSLKDIPDIVYHEDPPGFSLHFNRYLDSLFIVVIDPGHGGDNTGADGPAGTLEKHITLQIAHRLMTLLQKRKDIRAFLTRKDDRSVGLYERRRLANFWNADLFLSIHANSARNRLANHSEVYYASAHSRRPARIILEELEHTLNNGRGFIRRRGYAVIRGNFARLGAILVETMFLSNPTGERRLTNEATQARIAESLFRAVEEILSE